MELVVSLFQGKEYGGVVTSLWFQDPSNGHMRSLCGHEMIDGIGEEKKQSSATQISNHFLDSFFCKLLKNYSLENVF